MWFIILAEFLLLLYTSIGMGEYCYTNPELRKDIQHFSKVNQEVIEEFGVDFEKYAEALKRKCENLSYDWQHKKILLQTLIRKNETAE